MQQRNASGGFALLVSVVLLAAGGFLPVAVSAAPATRGSRLDPGSDMVPDWTDISADPYPLRPAVPDNPVLRWSDVSDDHAAYVADPFIFHENGLWYLFFEEYSGYGHIAVATSENGLEWHYGQRLDLFPAHLSFPYVFEYQGEHYLMPESGSMNIIQLFRAVDFPWTWQRADTLIAGQHFADPAIFRYNDMWYLFTTLPDNQNCYLYMSSELTRGWHEHPMSPVVFHDPSKARMAGRVLVLADNRIVRFAQKDDVAYGQAVRAFLVDTLTPTQYAEHEIPFSPVLGPGGSGWNAFGMHTCNPWWVGDHWLAAVDGIGPQSWSIGVYCTAPAGGMSGVPAPALPGAGAASGPPRIILGPASPNPFRDEIRLPLTLKEGGALRVSVFDGAGRLVKNLYNGVCPPGDYVPHWDGTGDGGRKLPGGVYYFSAIRSDETVSRPVVLIR